MKYFFNSHKVRWDVILPIRNFIKKLVNILLTTSVLTNVKTRLETVGICINAPMTLAGYNRVIMQLLAEHEGIQGKEKKKEMKNRAASFWGPNLHMELLIGDIRAI